MFFSQIFSSVAFSHNAYFISRCHVCVFSVLSISLLIMTVLSSTFLNTGSILVTVVLMPSSPHSIICVFLGFVLIDIPPGCRRYFLAYLYAC